MFEQIKTTWVAERLADPYTSLHRILKEVRELIGDKPSLNIELEGLRMNVSTSYIRAFFILNNERINLGSFMVDENEKPAEVIGHNVRLFRQRILQQLELRYKS